MMKKVFRFMKCSTSTNQLNINKHIIYIYEKDTSIIRERGGGPVA